MDFRDTTAIEFEQHVIPVMSACECHSVMTLIEERVPSMQFSVQLRLQGKLFGGLLNGKPTRLPS